MDDIGKLLEHNRQEKRKADIIKAESYNKTTTVQTTNIKGELYHLIEFTYYTQLINPYMFMERRYHLEHNGVELKGYGMSRDENYDIMLNLYKEDMERLKKGRKIEY